MFRWLLLDLLPVSQTSYKQVSKHLTKSMLIGEKMDDFTELYTSYLRFTFGTNSTARFPIVLTGFFLGFLLKIYAVRVPVQRCYERWGLLIMYRLLRPVQVQLRCKHAGVI